MKKKDVKIMIFELIESSLIQKGSLNVLIAGGTRAGKSTLAKKINSEFCSKYPVTIVKQDNYFKNIRDIPTDGTRHIFDSINAFHVEEFIKDVKSLISGKTILSPRYDKPSNTRIANDNVLAPGKINIIEGLHTILLLGDDERFFRLYLDTNLETTLERRIARDTVVDNVSPQEVIFYFNNYVLPMYKKYVLPQKSLAHLII
ncbi:MAG: uridine kinase family protein [Deltaproteobacteria bacterium]